MPVLDALNVNEGATGFGAGVGVGVGVVVGVGVGVGAGDGCVVPPPPDPLPDPDDEVPPPEDVVPFDVEPVDDVEVDVLDLAVEVDPAVEDELLVSLGSGPVFCRPLIIWFTDDCRLLVVPFVDAYVPLAVLTGAVATLAAASPTRIVPLPKMILTPVKA